MLAARKELARTLAGAVAELRAVHGRSPWFVDVEAGIRIIAAAGNLGELRTLVAPRDLARDGVLERAQTCLRALRFDLLNDRPGKPAHEELREHWTLVGTHRRRAAQLGFLLASDGLIGLACEAHEPTVPPAEPPRECAS